jgi:hypothetical protein
VILSVLQVICLHQQRSQHGHDRNETQAGRQDEDGETPGEIHGAQDVSSIAQALTLCTPRIS